MAVLVEQVAVLSLSTQILLQFQAHYQLMVLTVPLALTDHLGATVSVVEAVVVHLEQVVVVDQVVHYYYKLTL